MNRKRMRKEENKLNDVEMDKRRVEKCSTNGFIENKRALMDEQTGRGKKDS